MSTPGVAAQRSVPAGQPKFDPLVAGVSAQ